MAPVLTLRNILDCLVSFDDMMLTWRGQNPPESAWLMDPYALPLDYPKLAPADRYRMIGHTLGAWLIQFFVTWKRGVAQRVIRRRVIRYERDLVQPERFVELAGQWFGLTAEQRARLADYAANPDRERSRLNVGQPGRGRETVPEPVRQMLTDYAKGFGDE